MHVLKLIPEKVDIKACEIRLQLAIKKDIRKEIVKIKSFTVNKDHVHNTPKKHFKRVLDMLQAVNKETPSLLLTFSRFHILF